MQKGVNRILAGLFQVVTKRADSMANSQKSRYPDPRTGKDHASAHVRHEKRSPFCHQCASVPPPCPAVSVSVPFHSVSRNMHPWVLPTPNTAPQPLPESTPALSRMLTPSIRHPALIPCPAEDLSRSRNNAAPDAFTRTLPKASCTFLPAPDLLPWKFTQQP